MKVGIIGFGNMGSAITDGLLLKEVVATKDIFTLGIDKNKLFKNWKSRNINVSNSLDELGKNVYAIVISTPSKMFKDMILS